MADEGEEIDDASFWSIKLPKVERLTDATPDAEPEPGGENLFAVEFGAAGPTVSADLEVMVSDVGDEAQVIVEALDRLQDGLETWARVLARRPGAGRVTPDEG